MKIKLLFLLTICICFTSSSQISIGSNEKGELTDLDIKSLNLFKNTTTLFLLSDVLEKEVYKSILENSWTVTDYKLVSFKDFKIEDYLDGAYSIAQITGLDKTRDTRPVGASTGLFTFIDFRIYDTESISKKLAKLSTKKREKNKYAILEKYSHQIARFYLYPNEHLIETTKHRGIPSVVNTMFSEKVFFNYSPGMLKNYFQKINTMIKSGEGYAMHTNNHKPELQNLATSTLYIPEYTSITYNAWKAKDSQPNPEVIQNLFKEYEYSYKIISDSDLSDRIIKNEAFYYLRYVRLNGERFLQLINSTSGEIIYSNYLKGASYKLKPKLITDLNEKIKASGIISQEKGETIVGVH